MAIARAKKFFESGSVVGDCFYSPTLYTQAKTGKIRIWTACAYIGNFRVDGGWEKVVEPLDFASGGTAVYFTVFSSKGGKETTSHPTRVSSGKNIGRKNETTPFQQALLEISSAFDKKVKKGAKLSSEDLGAQSFASLVKTGAHRVNVMLLHDVNKGHWDRVKYPCYLQPKLDGVHLIAVWVGGRVDLYLRGIKREIDQAHIREALAPVISASEWESFYITGEMWTPGINRQEITSAVTVQTDSGQKKIIFNVFDVFSVDYPLPFEERYKLAIKLVREAKSPYIKLVRAEIVRSRGEIENIFKEYVSAGYEGAIIRDPDGLYEFGLSREIRSYSAMKMKLRPDFEFEITGFKEGVGKNRGLIIFTAITSQKFFEEFCDAVKPEVREFSVSPSWTEIERREAYTHGDDYIGKFATISFDSVSTDCIPVQPVLLAISIL